MKLNLAKVDTYGSANIGGTTYKYGWYHSGRAFIGGTTYKYGWYHSGRAFIAKEDEVMTFAEAFRELAPKNPYGYYDSFFCIENGQYYKKTTDGLVRYLLDKYNKD